MSTPFYTLKVGWTNDYLLRCSGGYLLIDTGFPQFYPRFFKELERLRVSLSDIKYLLLTHHHDDHSGFAARLVEATHAHVILHQDAVSPLSTGIFEFPGKLKPVNAAVAWVFELHGILTRRDFHFEPLPQASLDIVLPSGDHKVLHTLGIDGEILYTPGHTSDSLSVLLSDGNAFVGDLATNFINLLGAGYRPPYYEDMSAVFRGWRELARRGAIQVHPSHGKAFLINELTSRIRTFEAGQKAETGGTS